MLKPKGYEYKDELVEVEFGKFLAGKEPYWHLSMVSVKNSAIKTAFRFDKKEPDMEKIEEIVRDFIKIVETYESMV